MNEALDRKLTTNIQFKNKRFKKLEEESENIYLAADEVDKISRLDLTENPTLDKVRDIFIIACNTGLRFSDLIQLKSENIINDGLQIKITTRKTGEIIVVPIKSVVRQVFHKYNGELPSLLSNQKMNEYLKIIGEKAEISSDVVKTFTKRGKRQSEIFKKFDLITTHTARRSFATNAFLNDVPAVSIMKMTGHRTERAFMNIFALARKTTQIS
jgi:integrase